MKTMNDAHRPRIAWTVRTMFYYADDINYLTAIIVPFIHMYTTITKFIAGMCFVRSTQAPSQAQSPELTRWVPTSGAPTTSAAIVFNGRQGTSTESPLMPTQPPPGPWDLVGG